MRPRGAGVEFGVGLGGDEEGLVGKLHHFDDAAVGRLAAEAHARAAQGAAVVVVDLIAVAVALANVPLPEGALPVWCKHKNLPLTRKVARRKP